MSSFNICTFIIFEDKSKLKQIVKHAHFLKSNADYFFFVNVIDCFDHWNKPELFCRSSFLHDVIYGVINLIILKLWRVNAHNRLYCLGWIWLCTWKIWATFIQFLQITIKKTYIWHLLAGLTKAQCNAIFHHI